MVVFDWYLNFLKCLINTNLQKKAVSHEETAFLKSTILILFKYPLILILCLKTV